MNMSYLNSVILVLFSQAWIQRRVSGAILQDLQLLEVPVLRAGHGSGKLFPLIFSRTPGGIKAAISVGITVDKHVTIWLFNSSPWKIPTINGGF